MAWLTVLGIPAAVYVMGMTALMFFVGEKPQSIVLLLGTGFLTAGIYMFHRSAVMAVEQMQKRHQIALQHLKLLLLLSCLTLMIAVVIFGLHHPITTLIVFCSIAGVYVYGRKTITKPLRMFPYIKPLAVGVAIVLYGWVLNEFSNSVVTVLAFVLICSADALLCDLVDRDFDLATGCKTLAMQFGRRWTWFVTFLSYVIAVIGLQSTTGWAFLILMPIPIFFRASALRTIVDIRPAVILLLAWVL